MAVKRFLLIILSVVLMFSMTKDSRAYLIKDNVQVPVSLFQDGDLIFRKGTGIFSDLFSSIGKSTYSHVGLIKKKNNRVFVIHSDANELTGIGFVRAEPVEVFLNDDNAVFGALYRLEDSSANYGKKAAEVAQAFADAKVPFDTAFDLETENSLYCTELVWLAFKKAGIDIIKEPDSVDIPIFKKRFNGVISSGSILKGGKIIFVEKLKEGV